MGVGVDGDDFDFRYLMPDGDPGKVSPRASSGDFRDYWDKTRKIKGCGDQLKQDTFENRGEYESEYDYNQERADMDSYEYGQDIYERPLNWRAYGPNRYQAYKPKVASTVKVGRNCHLEGKCTLLDQVQIAGNAVIRGPSQIVGNVQVRGNAHVEFDGWIQGQVEISGNAQVFGSGVIKGIAQIYGNAEITGDVEIGGNTIICGTAVIRGGVWIDQYVEDGCWDAPGVPCTRDPYM